MTNYVYSVFNVYIKTYVFIVYISEHYLTISVHSDRVDGYRQVLHYSVFKSSGKHYRTQFQSRNDVALRRGNLCFL